MTHLPTGERIEILSRRIANLQKGAGDFPNPGSRAKAIADAEWLLEDCYLELAKADFQSQTIK